MARWAWVLATAAALVVATAGTALAAAPGVWSATGDQLPGGDAPLYTIQLAERPGDHLVATVTASAGSTHAALYLPGAGGFTEIVPPEVSTHRHNWPIAWGADGHLYLAQHLTSDCCSAHQLWEYTPSTDTWQVAGSTPAAAEALVAGTANILLLNPFRTFAYSPVTGRWSTLPRMPSPRLDFAAARSGGRYYVIGGRAPGSSQATGTVQVYRAGVGRWLQSTPMPHRRRGASAAAGPDGRVYVLGGIDPVGRAVPWVDVYNPVTGRWSSFAPTHGSPLAAAFAADGRLHAFGAIAEGTLERHSGGVERADDVPATDLDPPVFSDPPAPVMLAPRAYAGLAAVNAVWQVDDPSGVCFVNLQRSIDGRPYAAVASRLSAGNALGAGSPYAQSLPPGHVVAYRARAVDCAGNRTAAWSQGQPFRIAARGEQRATYDGTWADASGSSLTGGTARRTGEPGASASFTFTGSAVSWVANRSGSSAGGMADVYLDDQLFATVDTGPGGVVFTKRWASAAQHTVRIVAADQPFGTTVWVDGFLVLNPVTG